MEEALKLLKNEYKNTEKITEQNTEKNSIKILRLATIIEKLDRIIKGNLNHHSDLTNNEKYENEKKIMIEYIINKWGDCKSLRRKIEWEGEGYFYNSYSNVPASHEIYMDFFDDDCCWCSNCDESSKEDSEENDSE